MSSLSTCELWSQGDEKLQECGQRFRGLGVLGVLASAYSLHTGSCSLSPSQLFWPSYSGP